MQHQIIQNAVLAAASVMEDAIDAELDEDLDSLRAKRLRELKERAKNKDTWLALGHGTYDEITDEKEFFNIGKKSNRVVAHFFRENNFACKVIDKHLFALSRTHLEARFIKLNAEKCPFLSERLKLWMLPTIVLIKNGKTDHSIVGLDELGGSEDFPAEILEWTIGSHGVIDYDGPKPEFDKNGKKYSIKQFGKEKSIQNSRHNYDSDSEEAVSYTHLTLPTT
eukprot:TRINITY_DN803_c0_g1_i3.p1 TRINITY_DN803_c0_g1~~TRINITY_DN803_c0_g1_i3.p1  ORF type:complete len:238 (+),score=60.98 TRINITY_DN803_c0_g1_i3:47-715(+)